MLHLPGQTVPDWAATVLTGTGGKGIIDGLPEDAYHGTRALLGKSSLSIAYEKSGVHFADWLEFGERKERDTEAIVGGRAFHCAALEPDLFDQRFAVMPSFGPMQSSTNRSERDGWLRSIARKGQTALKPEWVETIVGMAAAVRKHPKAKILLRNCKPEVTALWVDPHTGLAMKSRADALSDLDGVYCDLKGCIDATPQAFKRTSREFRYYMQDPLYSRAFEENGVHIRNFAFIAVERTPPYAVAIYQMTDKARLAGEYAYQAAMMRVSRWVEDGHFPGINEDAVADLDVTDYTLADAEIHKNAEMAFYED